MKFHILTLFPDMIYNGLHTSIIGRAVEQGILEIHIVDIRDYTVDKHKKVDDYPYGGGAGMVMQAQPIYNAWAAITNNGKEKMRCVYLTPGGDLFQQQKAKEFATEEEIIFLCGHYEGVDERVLEEIVTDYLSAGDYVLTGGELPAMIMVDAIARMVPGVLSNADSGASESLEGGLLEYPQYTRPNVWRDKEVPHILLSGDHVRIEEWRHEEAVLRTWRRRPEIIKDAVLNRKDVKLLLKHEMEKGSENQ